MKSSKLWSSQFKQLRIEAWKSQDFNGVWTRDLAIPVRSSNQVSYEATDVVQNISFYKEEISEFMFWSLKAVDKLRYNKSGL